jgi:hypothetical protein
MMSVSRITVYNVPTIDALELQEREIEWLSAGDDII